jgi:hypothetical protein
MAGFAACRLLQGNAQRNPACLLLLHVCSQLCQLRTRIACCCHQLLKALVQQAQQLLLLLRCQLLNITVCSMMSGKGQGLLIFMAGVSKGLKLRFHQLRFNALKTAALAMLHHLDAGPECIAGDRWALMCLHTIHAVTSRTIRVCW